MRNWLDNCTRNHKNCKRTLSKNTIESDEGATLPSRVLDIGTSSDPQVNLVLTAGQRGNYAAVSYCWGTEENINLRTTMSNISAFTTTINEYELPQTIRDAVLVARKLQIRYLWVDSLCIIQDSDVDWKHESQYMGKIFENAICTIAATEAAQCNEGLSLVNFRTENQRNKTNLGSTRIPCVYQGNEYGDVLMAHLPDDAFDFDFDITDSRWYRRGWIVQERILSRRIIHFSKKQLYWECQTAEYRERDTKPLNDKNRLLAKPAIFRKMVKETTWFHGVTDHYHDVATVRSTVIALKDKARYLSGMALDLREAAPTLNRFWPRIVRTYNTSELSFETDKVPAIQGLAKSVASLTGMTYFGGLWLEDICRGLYWCLNTPDTEDSLKCLSQAQGKPKEVTTNHFQRLTSNSSYILLDGMVGSSCNGVFHGRSRPRSAESNTTNI
jgi:hypothetical protein